MTATDCASLDVLKLHPVEREYLRRLIPAIPEIVDGWIRFATEPPTPLPRSRELLLKLRDEADNTSRVFRKFAANLDTTTGKLASNISETWSDLLAEKLTGRVVKYLSIEIKTQIIVRCAELYYTMATDGSRAIEVVTDFTKWNREVHEELIRQIDQEIEQSEALRSVVPQAHPMPSQSLHDVSSGQKSPPLWDQMDDQKRADAIQNMLAAAIRKQEKRPSKDAIGKSLGVSGKTIERFLGSDRIEVAGARGAWNDFARLSAGPNYRSNSRSGRVNRKERRPDMDD